MVTQWSKAFGKIISTKQEYNTGNEVNDTAVLSCFPAVTRKTAALSAPGRRTGRWKQFVGIFDDEDVHYAPYITKKHHHAAGAVNVLESDGSNPCFPVCHTPEMITLW